MDDGVSNRGERKQQIPRATVPPNADGDERIVAEASIGVKGPFWVAHVDSVDGLKPSAGAEVELVKQGSDARGDARIALGIGSHGGSTTQP